MAKLNKSASFTALTIRERTIIEVRWCIDFKDMKAIAEELGRNYTTIKREIGDKPRKGQGKYNADLKQKDALDRIAKRGPKTRIRNKNWHHLNGRKITRGRPIN